MVTLGGKPVEIDTGERAVSSGWPSSGLLGLDVESTYMGDRGQFDPEFRVRTVQVATDRSARVFDLADEAQRERAVAILTDPVYSFCSHTNMDVLAVWAEFGIDISERNVDTRMLAIQAYPGQTEDRDLKTLATMHGMPELAAAEADLHGWFRWRWVEDKEITGGRKNAKKADVHAYGWNWLADADAADWPEVFTRYAGLDAIAARRLAAILTPLTQAPPRLLQVDQWLHVRSNRIQMRGLRLDRPAAEALHKEALTAFQAAKETAEEWTGGVNVNGPKILPWLAEHGVDWSVWPGAHTDGGAPSLAKENLKLLREYPLDEVGVNVLTMMQQQQRHADVKTKTGEILRKAVPSGDLWRIHPLLNPVGATTTARMSSSGPNVQNFSKRDPRMRGLFLPDPGHVLATIDFAQVELRVVAGLAREEKMIDTILTGGDLHTLTVDELASMGVTITRDVAKIVNFLIVYGGGPKALHDQTGIPLDEARVIIDAWRERYPAITALAKYLAFEGDAIRTISGRRLPVTRNKWGEARSYANINYAVQSAARELLVDGWMRFADEFGRDGMVWWPIHDELVLQIPEGMEAEVMADAEHAMTMEFRGVPIEAEAIVLRDRQGVSRWMTGKLAEQIAKEVAA